MRKVTAFFVTLPLVAKCGSNIMSWRANARVRNGNTQHPHVKKEFDFIQQQEK
jgi:hypothetical protein